MANIIKFIERLIAAEKAYEVNGEVYYSVRSFKDYGKLSNRKIDDLMSGVRIEVDGKKRDPMDFSLWKPAKPGEQSWSSPWGEGRPGWHIECSCMSYELLGEQIDIHGGGMDLVFPHHENEIAQSEGASGKQYVGYWLHNNMINFSGAKMSKSLGNIRTMRSFLEEYEAEVFKYLILSSHYRSETDFSENSINNSVAGLARIYAALRLADDFKVGAVESTKSPLVEELDHFLAKTKSNIAEAFNDDFNTAKAFAELFEVVRWFNNKIKPGIKKTAELKLIAQKVSVFIRDTGSLLALFQEPASEFLKKIDLMLVRQKNIDVESVEALLKQRTEARQAKNFQQADEIRQQLVNMGIEVHDAIGGSHWEVIK